MIPNRLLKPKNTPLRLAVGTDRLVAILPSGDVSVRALTSPDDLQEAVASVTAEAGAVRVVWCMLPPLVDVRRVEMPRLRREETTTLLVRHARRYFPMVRQEQAVGWRRIGRQRALPVTLMAAAAPEVWVEAAGAARTASGLAVADPVPAHSAWTAAARAAQPGFLNGAVAVADESRTYLLAVRRGVATDATVLPVGSGDTRERLAILADGGSIVVLGSGPDRDVLDPCVGESAWCESVDVLAARYSGDADSGLALLTTSVRQGRRLVERRAAARRWIAAASLVGAAALIEWWGVHRQLNAVQAARQAIAVKVSKAMAERETVERGASAVAALDSLEATATSWSGLLAAVTRNLPDGASLTTLRADSDSVAIDGLASDASEAFVGLRHVPGFEAVVARAPIRRETGENGPIERFSIGARLGRGVGPTAPSDSSSIHVDMPETGRAEGGGAP